MWTVKNKGGSPVKNASINRNFILEAERRGFTGEMARAVAEAAQMAQATGGVGLSGFPVAERALPPLLDWALNGSFAQWIADGTPLYYEKIGSPTFSVDGHLGSGGYSGQDDCHISANAGEGIRQFVGVWTNQPEGKTILGCYLGIAWTLLAHICGVCEGSWRLRLGYRNEYTGDWYSYRETVFTHQDLPQYVAPVWPAVIVNVPAPEIASEVMWLCFELVAMEDSSAISIDSFQLLPGTYDQVTFPRWVPPAYQLVEMHLSLVGTMPTADYRMGHLASEVLWSTFLVTANAGLANCTFTPKRGASSLTNLAVTLTAPAATFGATHYQIGEYSRSTDLMSVNLSATRVNPVCTLFGIRLPW